MFSSVMIFSSAQASCPYIYVLGFIYIYIIYLDFEICRANNFFLFALQSTGPRLRMLPELLAKHPYEGPDYDAECEIDSGTPSRFTRGQLESMLQASPYT